MDKRLKNKALKTNLSFTFEKLGPVQKADLELGDLTVIAGPNNTGKTYIAYTLYGLLQFVNPMAISAGKKRLHDTRLDTRFLYRRLYRRWFDGDTSYQKLVKDKRVSFKHEGETLSLSVDIDAYLEFLHGAMKQLCNFFSNTEIANLFSALSSRFEASSVQPAKGMEFALIPAKDIPTDDFPMLVDWEYSNNRLNVTIQEVDDELASLYDAFGDYRAYRQRDRLSSEGKRNEYTKRVLQYLALRTLIANIPGSFILPAERLGIALFYKELNFTESGLVRALKNLESNEAQGERSLLRLIRRTTSRCAWPLDDHIDYIREVDVVVKNTSELANHDLFGDITNIMGGDYLYHDETIFFLPKGARGEESKIPLHLASSSARGLAGVYFYLKHVARKGQLLIVDEPETHLDTANQIKMARLLARCVNAGVRVLITTHSDYIIKEFNNLVMLSADFEDKEAFLKEHDDDYSKNDFLKRESVRAYLCENGGLTRCKVDSRGMLIPMFDETIEDIDYVSSSLDDLLPDEL